MGWTGRKLRDNLRTDSLGRRALFLLLLVLFVVTTGLAFQPRSTAVLPDARPLDGSQPYATLLCKFAGPGQDGDAGWSVSYYNRLMLDEEDGLDKFWRQVSYGAIDLTGSKAFGWFEMAKAASAYLKTGSAGPDLEALARDCASAADASAGDALHFPDYVGINMVFSECLDRPRGGAVDLKLDGRTRTYRVTWLCTGYASSHQIVAHEMGHSFGLTHSEDSEGSEYGNNWDLMSNAAYCAPTTDLGIRAQQPIAYAKDVLGWIAQGEKYTAKGSDIATIQLNHLEYKHASSPGYLLAVLPLPGGRFYTVEARGRDGYDIALPSAGVLIHEVDPRRENWARLVQGEPTIGSGALLTVAGGWPVGSVFIDRQNNVAISVDGQVDQGFIVTLYTGALPWPLPADEHMASAANTIRLQWQPLARANQYEIQIARVLESGAPAEWGATFLTGQASLDAPLPTGLYRWRVRAAPAGGWSPPRMVSVGRTVVWRAPEELALLNGRLRVAPMVSAQANGRVEVAWAHDDQQRSLAVTRAAWQGEMWAVEDLFDVPPMSRRGLALSYTPAGDLKVAWPTAVVDSRAGISNPVVALDSSGRAHTIWAATGRGVRGIFSAIIDSDAPSAGPAGTQTPPIQPVPVADGAPEAAKYSPSIAVDGSGNAQAAWVDTRDGHSAMYGAEQEAGGSWGASYRISEANRSVYGRPSIAVNGSGQAYAVWQGGLDCDGPGALLELSFAERDPAGQWQQARSLVVATRSLRLIDPVVAANDAGEVFVAWGETKDGFYRLYAAYRGPGGHWEPPRLVGEGRSYTPSMALSLAVGPSGSAYLSWAEVQGTQASVRFAGTH